MTKLPCHLPHKLLKLNRTHIHPQSCLLVKPHTSFFSFSSCHHFLRKSSREMCTVRISTYYEWSTTTKHSLSGQLFLDVDFFQCTDLAKYLVGSLPGVVTVCTFPFRKTSVNVLVIGQSNLMHGLLLFYKYLIGSQRGSKMV